MANKKIRLRVVTPAKQLYDENIDMVIMRTTSGDVGIMANHQPLTTTLGYGILRILNDSEEIFASVFGGFAQIKPDCITILSDAAEWPDEIDTERAKASKERAEKRITSGSNEIDVARAELALKRALIRLEVAKK